MYQAIIGAVASLAGGAMGADASAKSNAAAKKAADKAMGILKRVDIPDIEKQKLVLEELASSGQFTPEMLEAIAMDDSSFEDISVDPRLKQEQMKALDQISGLTESGLSEGDLASIELAKREADAASKARQASIVQEMQQRGMGGSGVELAARLSGAQEASDRGAQAALETAKLAAQQRLSALSQLGSMSGNIRQQDYGEQKDLASARDIINQFNTQNRQKTNQSNVELRNQAQAVNLAERQRIADANVNLANQQQQYNKGLLQQDYQNRLGKAQAQAGQQTSIGNLAATQAANTGAMYSTIGQGIGKIVAGFGQKDKED
jgi:hypothetical protein